MPRFDEPWRVELRLTEHTVQVFVEAACDTVFTGPPTRVYDCAERRGQPSDTCQCTTLLVARVPQHDVKTVRVLGVEKESRLALRFNGWPSRG